MEKISIQNGDFSILDGETVNHSFEKKHRYMIYIYIYKQKPSKVFWQRQTGEISFLFSRSLRQKKYWKIISIQKKRFSPILEIKKRFFFEKTTAKRFSKKVNGDFSN